MKWKEQMTELMHKKDYVSAIEQTQKFIKDNPDEVEAYIQGIYLTHYMLLEEDCTEAEREYFASLLRSYFDTSYRIFANNPEYLFFIGKILYIAEWYFGLDDDIKPMEERRAFQMQQRAHEIEPENVLYEWAYRFSLGEELATRLAEQILSEHSTKLDWLKSRGFAGEYILSALEYSRELRRQ